MVDANEVYYRVLRRGDGGAVVATLQWFDEYDYDQANFITDVKFDTEKDALQYADNWMDNNASTLARALVVACQVARNRIGTYARGEFHIDDMRTEDVIRLLDDVLEKARRTPIG